MIPKKIHYIWLGKNSYPNLMDICITLGEKNSLIMRL